ncbi:MULTISPECIES: histidine phosphatase family protein [unclassified Clostridium]|uniref:histidine phosphatase family protein n=1 Tax=unclassified Clostridium TaxID=2614128 RepID=UPI001106035A|nr:MULTISPECIES: histidine phosphatase family protein [unclassified Clostridium]
MKLYIIRHGQTDWNVQGRIQGRQDIPLNAAGRSQAGMLALGMKERPVSAVYSSPQLRAMETARALAEDQGVEVISVPELVEIGYGNWEGRTAQDILTRERKLYEEWWQHPATVAPPGGETLNQVDARCKKAWDRIKREMRGDTAVVAHGGTLAHFIVHLLEGRQDAEEIVVGNASITTMEYDPAAGQCSLLELNDCSHLMQK